MADSINGGSMHFDITFNVEQAKSQVDELRTKLGKLGDAMEDQDKEIAKLENQYAELGKQAANAFNAGDDKLFASLKNQQDEIKKSLASIREERAGVAELSDEYERHAEAIEKQIADNTKLGGKQKSLRTEMRAVREQMVAMEMAGEKGSAAYMELADKAGQLQDAMMDTSLAMRNMASDTRAMDATMGALSLGSGLMEGFTGAMGALGASTEEAANMQTKLQSAMALAQGVQQAQMALQKESALMLGIETIKRKANAAAIKMETAAQGKGTVATKAATVAQRAFNLVANANPYVLLATALMTVVGAIAAFAMGTERASKKQKEMNALEKIHIDQLQRINEEHNRASNERIKGYENELNIAKQKVNNEKEVRSIEDKIYKERAEQSKTNKKDNDEYIKGLDKNRENLSKLKKQLDDVETAKAKGKKRVKVDIELNGDLDKMKIDDALEILQGKIDQTQSKIEVAVKTKDESASLDAERKAQLEQRKKEDYERYKNLSRTQTEIKRKEIDNELALMQEGFDKENAMRKASYERAVEDLKNRLKYESETLTKAARESINNQIKQQKELYDREQRLAEENLAKRKAEHQESIEARYRALEEQTPQNMRNNLSAEFLEKKKALQRELDISTTTKERREEIANEFDILRFEEQKAMEDLNKEIATQSLANAVEVMQARIDVTRDGNEELLKLNLELLDRQLDQELDAINNNVTLTSEQKKDLIELAKTKTQIAKEDLIKENEVEKFGLVADYASIMADAVEQMVENIDSPALRTLVNTFKGLVGMSDKIAESMKFTQDENGNIKFSSLDMSKLSPNLFAMGFQMVLSSIVSSVQEMQALKQTTKEWLNTLELVKYQLEDIYSNAFGEDVYQRGIDAAKKQKEAQEAYEKALDDANRKGIKGWSDNTRYAQTLKVKGGSTLYHAFPELFDEDGNLKTEDLENFLEVTGDVLKDSTREYLENILKLKKTTEELGDELANYTSNVFGPMSDALLDGIVNAVRTGTESWVDFEKAGTDAIETIIKQMAQSAFLKPIFDEYESELANLYGKKGKMSEEEYLQEQMKLMQKYIGELEGGANRATQWIREQISNGGMEGLFSSATEKSVAGAISTVTEQTANIIAGQMNAIRMGQMDANSILRDQLMTLSGIKADTYYIKKIYDAVSGGATFNERAYA